ncbi:MAG: histidine kinase N-terminal 7TM domain-containing protein, partial [Patescibacteria group bacterium]
MSFYAISALINALTSLILGVIILRKKKSNINISFVLFCFSVSFWSVAYFLWQVADNSQSALLWCKILTVFSLFIPLFYLRFTLFYLEADKILYNRILLYVGYLFVIFLAFISPSDLLVERISSKLAFKFWPVAGGLYWLFLLMFFSFVVYSVVLFIVNYKYSIGVKRLQIKFLLLGTGIGFLGGSTNFFLWYNIPILPIGNILVSLYVILTAYAIIAHRLMDIKLVMRRYSVYLSSLISILLAAVGIKYVFDRYLPQYSDWIDLVILMGSISVYPAIRNYFYRIANKYFFSSLYDSGEVIASLSEKLRSTLEAEKIYGYIFDTLSNAFHAKAIGILTYNEKTKKYIINYNNGFNTGGQQEFDEDKKLNEIYIKRNRTIITD